MRKIKRMTNEEGEGKEKKRKEKEKEKGRNSVELRPMNILSTK